MLNDRSIAPPTSPYATPFPSAMTLGSGYSSGYSFASDLAPDPDDEPLWVLPKHLIPKSPSGVPGARMTRDRGYLDTPDTIAGVSQEPLERNSARLEAGLGWDYCGPRPPYVEAAPTSESTGDNAVELDAGGVSYRQNTQIIDAVGGVTLARGGQRIDADSISYDRRSGDVFTSGETYLEYPGLRIIGDDAEFNLESDTGRIDNPRYRLSGPINLRGRAGIAHIDSPKVTRYENLTYTSCPPGSNAWALRAGKLRLDQDSGRGIAKNARLRILGIPVLYTPYIDFPIDDRRKSGFLIPSFGTSDDNGFELITPYYWNIAPNLDATFFPRYMSERGLMLGGEFRYLSRWDRGEVTAEVMPSDKQFEDGGARGALNIEQEGLFFRRLRTRIDYSRVSDDQYLEDLGNSIDTTSTRRLRQRGDVTYYGRGWSFLTSVQAFQNLDRTSDPGSRPYERLPQLLLRINPRTLGPGLVAGVEAEYDYFDHESKVHGQRFAMLPAVSWPVRRSFGHLIPSANLHLASYSLSEQAADQPTDPGHAIPSFDLDGRLILERDASWFGEDALQTLEPRLFYLYTPYVDQDDTPVFDSSELTFSFSNLFRSNRFTGRDRIGDANQVTAALTSRMLRAASGEELFRLSLGQIYYFADRRVQINGPEETADQSPYTGELTANLFEHWYGRASFEWDPELDEDQLRRRTLQLEYRDPENRLLNLAYRADDSVDLDNRYEDTDMSFRLPLGQRVEVVGRWLYSVLHGETMDAFAGIEYGKCCWRVRLLGRHFKRRPDDIASTSVMLQLELAGLGAIGNPVGKFLEEEIYGYEVK
ncbi:MAG: LPS assembly protein LptD [Thiohalocapsa sp.]